MVEYLSEGIGLKLLIAGLVVVLAGIAFTVRRSSMGPHLGNICLPSGLMALALLFFVMTFSFPEEEVGPAVVPHLWIFWTIVLCGAILVQVVRRKDKPDPAAGRLGFLALVVLMLAAYYFAMQLMGYFLSTFLFLVLLMQVLGYRKKVVMVTVAGGWVGFSYVVFYKLLFIQLPLGYFEQYF